MPYRRGRKSFSVATDTDASLLESTEKSGILRKRKRTLEEWKRRCPRGWQLDPKTLAEQEKDEGKDQMIPGMVPTRWPLHMSGQYVLDHLQSMPEIENASPLIDKKIAQTIASRTDCSSIDVIRLNAVVFQKRQRRKTIAQKWLRLRILQDSWQSDDRTRVYRCGTKRLKINERVLDARWMTTTVEKSVSKASVFIMLVENLTEMETALSVIIPSLNEAYPESHLVPPFICFVSTVDIEEDEIKQIFHQLNLQVGIRVVSIVEHLNYLRDRLYQRLCQKWSHLEPESTTRRPVGGSSVDPFSEVEMFLTQGLLVPTTSMDKK